MHHRLVRGETHGCDATERMPPRWKPKPLTRCRLARTQDQADRSRVESR